MVAIPSFLLLLVLIRPWNGKISLSFFGQAFAGTHCLGLFILGLVVSLYSSRPRTKRFWLPLFVGCAFLNIILWGALALIPSPRTPDMWEHYTNLSGVLVIAAVPSVAISAIAGVLFNRLQMGPTAL